MSCVLHQTHLPVLAGTQCGRLELMPQRELPMSILTWALTYHEMKRFREEVTVDVCRSE